MISQTVNLGVPVSFDQVKAHIQNYLKNLEENLLSPDDRTELSLLFVNCFQVLHLLTSSFRAMIQLSTVMFTVVFFCLPQDSLLCSEVREVEQSREQQRKAETGFLSRIARKQTPSRQEDPAEFLLNTARLRICLSSAARLLETAAAHGA